MLHYKVSEKILEVAWEVMSGSYWLFSWYRAGVLPKGSSITLQLWNSNQMILEQLDTQRGGVRGLKLSFDTKINPKWITDLNVNLENF